MILLELIFNFLAYFALNLLLFCFIEWGAHRFLMHSKSLPKSIYGKLSYFEDVFRNHAVLHHRKFYSIYDFEDDPEGKHLNLRFTVGDLVTSNVLLMPLHGLYFMWEPVGSAALFCMLLTYMFLWNGLHTEMHIPTNRWYFRNAVFRFLNRHHYLHHCHPGRNFNVVLPLPDYIFGTVVRASTSETEDMRRLGLYENQRGPRFRASLH